MNIMKKSILFLSAYMMLWSCSTVKIDDNLSPEQNTVVIEASIGGETKTTMGPDGDSRKVVWSEGDKITLAYGFRSAIFRTDEGGSSSASFVLESNNPNINFEDGVMAAYPADACSISTPDSEMEIYVNMPSIQNYVQDSFDDQVMPMLSDISYDDHLVFRNIAGVLRLMISSDCGPVSVESITLTADKPLSGGSWYMPSTDKYLYDDNVVAKGKNALRLQTDVPVEVSTDAVPFNVVVPHQIYEDLSVRVCLADGTEQIFNMKEGRTLDVQRSTILNLPLTVDRPVKSNRPYVNLTAGDIDFDSFKVSFKFENTEQYYCGLVKSRDFNKENVLFSLDYLTPSTAASKINTVVTRVHADFSEFLIHPGASYVFWIVPCNPEGIYSESDIVYVEVKTKDYQSGGSVSVTGLSNLKVEANSVEFDMNVGGYEKIFCQLVRAESVHGMDESAKIALLLDPENYSRSTYDKENLITSFAQRNISSGTDYLYLALAVDQSGRYGKLFEQGITTPDLPYNDLKVTINKDVASLPQISWSVTGGDAAVYKYLFCSTDEYKWTGVFGSSIDNIQERMFLESSLYHFSSTTSTTLQPKMEKGKEYVFVVSALTKNANKMSSEVDYWIFRY